MFSSLYQYVCILCIGSIWITITAWDSIAGLPFFCRACRSFLSFFPSSQLGIAPAVQEPWRTPPHSRRPFHPPPLLRPLLRTKSLQINPEVSLPFSLESFTCELSYRAREILRWTIRGGFTDIYFVFLSFSFPFLLLSPELSDKVVVISGISKGLGRSLAIELAKRGLTVVGCARNEEKLSELEKLLRDTGSSKHLLKKVDVVWSLSLSLSLLVV